MLKKIILISLFLILFFGGLQLRTGPVSASVQEDPPNYLYLPIISKIEPPKWIGPDGGSIVSLAISKSDPNVLYAGSWGAGVFKSTDGGATWSPVNKGLPGLLINAIAVDPKNSNVAYAGPYKQKLYKTVNGGASWFSVSSGLQVEANVYGIGIDGMNTNRIFITTRGVSNGVNPPWNGVVYKSSDGGASWKNVLANVGGSNDQDWAYDIAVHPKYPQLVLLAMHEFGTYRSIDYGEYFTPQADGLTDKSGRTIVVSPIAPSLNEATAYYGVWHWGGTYKSIDSGQTWGPINYGSAYTRVYKLAMDPHAPNTLYLASWSTNNPPDGPGIIKTVDGGEHWYPVYGLVNINLYTVAVSSQFPYAVYAGTKDNGLYWSFDGGKTWSPRQRGISNVYVNSILVQPDANPSVFASYSGGGIGLGVSLLQDEAAGWQDFNSGLLPEKLIKGLVQNPASSNLIYALTSASGLYRADTSIPNPVWTRIDVNLPTTTGSAPVSSPDFAIPSREEMEADVEPILETPVDTQAPQAATAIVALQALVFAPSEAQTAYLGTAGMGVYKSTNGGVNWSAANTGMASASIVSVAVSPTNPSVVYAAPSTSGVVYYSDTGGTSWATQTLPSSSTVYSVVMSALDDQRVYAGTNNGVYVQVSGGVWNPSSLTGVQVTSLAAHPSKANVLIAGTTAGAYRSTDYGATWSPVVPELETFTIRSIAFDPLKSQNIYFGTTTSGIVHVSLP